MSSGKTYADWDALENALGRKWLLQEIYTKIEEAFAALHAGQKLHISFDHPTPQSIPPDDRYTGFEIIGGQDSRAEAVSGVTEDMLKVTREARRPLKQEEGRIVPAALESEGPLSIADRQYNLLFALDTYMEKAAQQPGSTIKSEAVANLFRGAVSLLRMSHLQEQVDKVGLDAVLAASEVNRTLPMNTQFPSEHEQPRTAPNIGLFVPDENGVEAKKSAQSREPFILRLHDPETVPLRSPMKKDVANAIIQARKRGLDPDDGGPGIGA